VTRPLHSFETAAIIRDLGRKIKPASKLVLIALRIHGGGTVDELVTAMHLPAGSVYSALDHLRSMGLVVRTEHLRSNGQKFYTFKIAAMPAVVGAGGQPPGHTARSLEIAGK
jgi:DNA-binding MarR family transcriptional regulator